MLKGRADSKGQSAFLSFRAMDRIMQNVGGESFSYEGFKQMYDSTPALKELIKDFNEDGITIATTDQADGDASQADQGDTRANVTAAAKRATNR